MTRSGGSPPWAGRVGGVGGVDRKRKREDDETDFDRQRSRRRTPPGYHHYYPSSQRGSRPNVDHYSPPSPQDNHASSGSGNDKGYKKQPHQPEGYPPNWQQTASGRQRNSLRVLPNLPFPASGLNESFPPAPPAPSLPNPLPARGSRELGAIKQLHNDDIAPGMIVFINQKPHQEFTGHPGLVVGRQDSLHGDWPVMSLTNWRGKNIKEKWGDAVASEHKAKCFRRRYLLVEHPGSQTHDGMPVVRLAPGGPRLPKQSYLDLHWVRPFRASDLSRFMPAWEPRHIEVDDARETLEMVGRMRARYLEDTWPYEHFDRSHLEKKDDVNTSRGRDSYRPGYPRPSRPSRPTRSGYLDY